MGDSQNAYDLGDMVWAKVASYPPWPAMVYLAPNDEGYIKEPASGQKSRVQYHVQFFGPMVERAWSAPGRLRPYKGKAEFDDDVEDAKNGNNKQKKEFYSLKIKGKLQTAWEESWKEAEFAFQLDREDRISRFGRFYISSVKKTKKSLSPIKHSTPVEKSLKPKVSECGEVSGDVLTGDEEQIGLENFLESEKALVIEETPDIDPEMIEESLRNKWARMDIKLKKRFILADYSENYNGSTSQRLSESKVSGRKIKPSNKGFDQLSKRQSQSNSNIWRKGIKRHKGNASEADDSISATPPRKRSKTSSIDPNSPTKSLMKRMSTPVNIPDEQVYFEIQRLVSSPGEFKVQAVCPVCEIHSENMEQCQGGCFRHFHIECVRTKFQNASDLKINGFECPFCLYDQRECMICNSNCSEQSKFVTCPESKCGRIFHKSCISSFPHALFDDNSKLKRCPAHFCISCKNEQPDCKEAQRGDLITCIKCPLAFHAGDICMAAGSIERSLSQVVCPRHFAKSLLVTNKPVSMTSCFICQKQVIANKILCCECPGTFHTECLDVKPSTMSEEYRCPLCSNMQPIRYSQIVWAKVAHYRWWPCEVIHPRNAPMNILKIAHPDGAFPVHFFGAQEYQWISRQRVIIYQQGLNLNLDRQSGKPANKMAKMFCRGVEDVKKAHRLYVAYVSSRLPLKSMFAEPMNEKELMTSIEVKPIKKATGFKFIKQSIYTKDELKFPEVPVSHLPVCSCKPTEPQPCSIGPNSGCSNVNSRVECHPQTCPAGSICANQVFTKRSFQVLGVFETKNRGHGLRAMDKIVKGTFVVDFVGEIIDRAEVQERLRFARKCNSQDFYMMRLDELRVIDAGPCGNLSRYINHSCRPNLTVEIWKVNNETRVGFFAKEDIAREEELTFNYSNLMVCDDVQLCLCGSNMCQGYMGADQTLLNRKSLPSSKRVHQQISSDLSQSSKSRNNSDSISQEAQVVVKKRGRGPSMSESSKMSDTVSVEPKVEKKKRTPSSAYMLHENICYRCLDGGELVLCDKKYCTKSYHLGCLGLTKPPTGIWYCPWHHCDDCGLPSTNFCSECPNSYCEEHLDDSKIYKQNGDKIVCSDHKTDTGKSLIQQSPVPSEEPCQLESKSPPSEEETHEEESGNADDKEEVVVEVEEVDQPTANQMSNVEDEVKEIETKDGGDDKELVEEDEKELKDGDDKELVEEDEKELKDGDDKEVADVDDKELNASESKIETDSQDDEDKVSLHQDDDDDDEEEEEEDIDDGEILHEDEPDLTNDDSMMNNSYSNNETAEAATPDDDDEESELVEEVEINSHSGSNEDEEIEDLQDADKSLETEHETPKTSNQESSFNDMF